MQYSFDEADIRQQVLDFITSLGLKPDKEWDIILDGELHRYKVHDDKRGNKSGAICIHTDGWPAGFAMDWRDSERHYWKYNASGLDEEQRKYFNSEEFKKKYEEEHRIAEEKRKNRRLERSDEARKLWGKLAPAPEDHPYLVRKKVYSYGLRFNHSWTDGLLDKLDDCLAVPLCNIEGQVMSIQWIPADKDRNKLFYWGAETKGTFFSVALDIVDKDYTSFILLGEGYATMAKIYELTHYPCVAAMTCSKLQETAEILLKAFPKSKIIIMADNDWETEQKRGYNPGIKAAKTVIARKLAVDYIAPAFTAEDIGCSDWDDYALKYGDDKAARILQEKIEFHCLPEIVKSLLKQDKLQTINAQALRSKVFKPIKWAVPGFLLSGASILGGGPKIGKSIMSLNIAIGVAIGGRVLGKIDVEQGDVLYLALEDNERRLQERIEGFGLAEDNDISRLTLTTRVPRQHEGGIEYIKSWLDTHKGARLVIIDTLQKFRKQLSGKGNVYAEDYDVISELKRVADAYDVAFLIIHHLKKMSVKQELADDWINSFSGSAGLSGSADALFVLRRERSSCTGHLLRTGRDVEEKEFVLKLDGFGWNLEGEAEAFTLPAWKKQIFDFLKEHESVTPMELSEGLGLSDSNAKQSLRRLEKSGELKKIGYGKYSLP